MSFQKKHAIRDLRAGSAAQDIDDNFDAVWNALRALRNQLDEDDDPIAVAASTTPGPPGLQGEDGGDGSTGPPGVRGIDGAPGITGAAGPVTLGPMGLDGQDGDDGAGIPGPQGLQGAQGIQGPAGPVTLGPMGLDGVDGDDGYMLGIGSSSSSSSSPIWTLIEARACSASANEDFIGLSGYAELFTIFSSITKGTTGTLECRVSTDNGANFLTASGDYENLPTTGAPAVQTSIGCHVTNATVARTGFMTLRNFNNAAAPKFYWTTGVVGGGRIPTTTALNAIRFFGSGGGNLTGGTLYVYGRTGTL